MLSLLIGGVERVQDLDRQTLDIQRNLTHEIDTCSFSLKGDALTEGEEVVIEKDDTRLFAGIIVKTELGRTFYKDKTKKVWNVDCDDYTALLDKRLVVETYENMPADEIFRDIAAKYCPDFTVTGVQSGAPIIENTGAEFEYKRPSECFRWLCDYVGWHWQPDYFKDLQFFSPDELTHPAPLVLTPGGAFSFGKHSIDTQGLRNQIYVLGGKILSDMQDLKWKADGESRVWTLPWTPHEASLTVNEIPQGIGIESVDDEADFDYVLNLNDKYLRCSKFTDTPAAGITLALKAKQDIDVITMLPDEQSQQAIAAVQGGDGIYEHVITDDSLVSLEAAEAAANADLREHANPKVKGNFSTEVEGWEPGQLVEINLPDRGIVGTYLVQKVTLRPVGKFWQYTIDYGGRLLGIADFLKALVSQQQKQKIGDTAIISKFDRQIETVGITDELTATPRNLPYRCGDLDAICGFVMLDSGGDWVFLGSMPVSQANWN